MPFEFTPIGGGPVDPAYTRFHEGLAHAAADAGDQWVWRWQAGEQKWFTYAHEKWVMDDFGAADTAAGWALRQEWGWPKSSWTVVDTWVPDLFKRLQAAAAKLKVSHPQAVLVWSPWNGGDWRAALPRPAGHPAPGPGPGPTPPPECMKRIEDVKGYERSGVITHDQAQRLIEGIVAECT